MSQPIVLSVVGTPLYRQVQAYLATDTDSTYGLLLALGNGANSIYPNFTTDGPNSDRSQCATPFLIVVSGGVRAVDASGREIKTVIEVHDDADHGDERWPGILARIKTFLLGNGNGSNGTISAFKPVSDQVYRYISGLTFEEESPPNLPDQRFDTNAVQIVFACRALDRTSSRGHQG